MIDTLVASYRELLLLLLWGHKHSPGVDWTYHLLPSFNSTASPLRILELCSGSASFSNFASSMFPSAEIVTLDIDKKFAPTHVDDILTWNYLEHYPANYFHIIWGSPPCLSLIHI